MSDSTIVIGVSYFPTALAACRRAMELARVTDADLHLVYAIGSTDEQGRSVAKRDAQHLTDALATASSKPATTHVVEGPAAAAILEVAGQVSADLIVVGNRGLVINGQFTDDVAAQVLKGAMCSVLVVHTTDSN